MILSVCGLRCDQCNFFPEDCAGCPEMQGKPFWTRGTPEKACGIYLCVSDKKKNSCGECSELPCGKFDATRDPAVSEDDHRKGILDRVNRLKSGPSPTEQSILSELGKDNPDKAVERFLSGMNCSQAILSTYADAVGLDKGTAMRIAGGFGAGMARMQETCGAVTGAVMVIGMRMINRNTGPDDLRGPVYDTIQELFRRFREKDGTTECSELLHLDLRTPEGRKRFHDDRLNEIICTKCVRDAAEILDGLLSTK